MHTTAARQLMVQKYQEEYETLCREQCLSFDYWVAKAESYYNKKMTAMMKEQESGNEISKKLKNKITQSTERQKPGLLVPEKEMNQIEKHILQAEQTRKLNKKTFGQIVQPPSEITFPKIVPAEPGIQNTQRRKQLNEREQMQIKNHQARMIQGRKLTEQKLKGEFLRKRQRQPLKQGKQDIIKEEIKELETTVVYPLFQPDRNLIKVNILMEKSQNQEDNTFTKPYRRKFLTIPPFLRSQIEKMKDQ